VKVLTVRQPWAWAIIFAGKDVENRSWTSTYRGPVAIHAGRRFDEPGAGQVLATTGFDVPDHVRTDTGLIIGVVDLIDVVDDSVSQWAQPGLKHLVFANPRPIHPLPWSGSLGLRDLPEDVELDVIRAGSAYVSV